MRIAPGAFLLAALTTMGCGNRGDGVDVVDNGTAVVALSQAPSDVSCVQVTVEGTRTVTRSFDVQPGSSTEFFLSGLPTGQVDFTGNAFQGGCSTLSSSSVPTWVGDPVSAYVVHSPPSSVTLQLRRNGRVNVTADFVDCGNGVVESPDETCDDGNLTSGDGCSFRCQVEPGFTCTGQPSVCTGACADVDRDGFGDAVCGGGDCDDGDARIFPGAPDPCGDTIDQDCDGVDLACPCQDVDRDGFGELACGGGDCDDNNAQRFPGAPEVCGDNVDQDCDGQDAVCACFDNDQDGFTSSTCGGADCNDTNASINPARPELCDGLDNDCDAVIDDGNPGGGASCSTGQLGVCSLGVTQCSNGAVVCVATNQPSPEVCDGRDNNCNGTVDEGNPGGGSACNTGRPGVCAAGTTACVGGALSCVQNIPAGPEQCGDALDNDCDGLVNEGC
ncbi:MAG: MopE-related protein [Myxococcota bacterium]